jgi:hypothetical protein
MYIKIWNDHCMDVFEVNPKIKKSQTTEFKPEEEKELKKIAKRFLEIMGLEFEHNLKRGWENKLLANGKILNRNGDELKTKKAIRAELSEKGIVQFHHHKKNRSMNFINKEVKKPAHLCWR